MTNSWNANAFLESIVETYVKPFLLNPKIKPILDKSRNLNTEYISFE